MTNEDIWQIIDAGVEELASDNISIFNSSNTNIELPSLVVLRDIVDLVKSIIFPGFYDKGVCSVNNVKYQIGVALERLFFMLENQIERGLCFEIKPNCCGDSAKVMTSQFIKRLPYIKEMLYSDVDAVLRGDPAAKSRAEVVFCYPGITAITHHRIAHELLLLGAPLIARIISEMAHSATGIDIHPGATIGRSFCIDHGTGIVIGETCIIGDNVKLYQGVTLGAKSFHKDEQGNILNTPRHPIIEDNVVIYSNTSVLGRITLGANSIVGGNIWLTHGIPAGSKVIQPQACYPTLTEEV